MPGYASITCINLLVFAGTAPRANQKCDNVEGIGLLLLLLLLCSCCCCSSSCFCSCSSCCFTSTVFLFLETSSGTILEYENITGVTALSLPSPLTLPQQN